MFHSFPLEQQKKSFSFEYPCSFMMHIINYFDNKHIFGELTTGSIKSANNSNKIIEMHNQLISITQYAKQVSHILYRRLCSISYRSLQWEIALVI